DIFGNVGCDPGTAWTSGGKSTKNIGLVSKGCITDGITSDPPDAGCSFPTLGPEWIEFPSGDLSHLGRHGYLSGSLQVNVTAPTFCGGNDGSMEISADGNGLEYSINGSSGPFQISSEFNGLSSNNFNVMVR